VQILVLPDAEAVAARAAAMIAETAATAIRKRGRFHFAVSGGSTPWLMLERLAALPVDWRHVHVFQVDERVAPDNDPSRNWTHVNEAFLSRVHLPREQAHAMPVMASDLRAAAVEYEAELRRLAGTPPKLDLVHLGLGMDGHTASLVPGDPALAVKDAEVTTTNAYQGHLRLTLTFQAINRARNVLWLATGHDKREMLLRLLHGDRTIPAGRVGGVHATVMTDTAAMTLSGDSNA
jgi:6-phosphogluconolactonase